MPKKGVLVLTADDIRKALRSHYSGKGVVTLSEVRNGTGYERSARTADVLAVSTWPSRGLYAEGIEIKVTKHDLRTELANPKKADDIAKYCRLWWLATPEGLIDEIDLPAKWGVMEVNSALKIKIRIKPVELCPVPMDTLFVCSVLRNFTESYTPNVEVEEKIRKGVEDRVKARREGNDRRLKDLEEGFAKWKTLTGIDLLDDRFGGVSWDLPNIAQAVNLLRSIHGLDHHSFEHIKQCLDAGREALERLSQLPKGEAA